MVKIDIYLTTSKTAAYLILLFGTIFSFIFKDGTVLISTFGATSAILMMKTYTTKKNSNSEIG